MTLCIVIGIVSVSVSAASDVSATVNGIAVPTAGGSITGEGISGSIFFDAAAKTLTLENATISVTAEQNVIKIDKGIDTVILKGKNEIKWADESDKNSNICAIYAGSSFLIRGDSREDSLTVTLPGTTGDYRRAYAISLSSGEIRDCSLDITLIAGMQNGGDNVAIRVPDGNIKVKNAVIDLTVGKNRKGDVQKAKQGACIFSTGMISIENSYVNAGIYSSLDASAAYYYSTLQGYGGITCTDSVVYAVSDVLKAGRTICLDGVGTTFLIKNSIFKVKSNQYAVQGYSKSKPNVENSLAEFESKGVVLYGTTFGTISGFTKITATDKDGNTATYKPGDDFSTLSADSRKVVIDSQIHSHCLCGGETAFGNHTVHSPLMWTPWTKTDSLPASAGNYYLTDDVLLNYNSAYSMPNGVYICLNGHSIRGVNGAEGLSEPVLSANGGTLTVTDCGTKGTLKDITMSSGRLTMYSGSVPSGSKLIIAESGGFIAQSNAIINGNVTNSGTIFDGTFNGEVLNEKGTVNGGTFTETSEVTVLRSRPELPYKEGRIKRGKYYGRVNLDGGDIDDGEFTASSDVNLKNGRVFGGIYYGKVTYGEAVIHDNAYRYLTLDTDGDSVIDTQRILRGQKATPPTEKPTKVGYIFGGWTAFDFTKPFLENSTLTAIWSECNHSGNTAQPTCTDTAACTVCGGTIAALGHDFSVSVWQHDDNEHWKKCSRCDAKNDENAHNWDNGVITIPSTCTTAGEKTFTCTVCKVKKPESIDAKGHDVIFHKGKSPTCNEKGWKDYYTCSKCDYTTYTEIAATGNHTYEWQSENGRYWKKCKVCNLETAKKDIPVLTIIGADRICRKHDYKFSFTLPSGCKNPICWTASSHFTEDNGVYSGTIMANDMLGPGTEYTLTVVAETADGFEFKTTKTITVLDSHKGGTADCHTKAVCNVCGDSYGEFNADNHTDLVHFAAKSATKETEGNTEYWYCKDCDRYYSDAAATKEITKDDTVTAKLPPVIIKGDGLTVMQGEKTPLLFTLDAAFSDFIRAELDGETIDEKNYEKRSGSTVITLNAEYVAGLSAGEHTIGIVSASGTATAKFTVKAPSKEHQMGDSSLLILWIAMFIISSGVLIGVTVFRKNNKFSTK